ncbi:uncharacterized protein LOC110014351 [Oryzias latipes]|uniref:uncharacterized protein LOC110014351 n=1 Tax=Oryzias latipes TaxID=8090 RepID=UPI000CE17D38|nr:uncharacterized protein LOC110014351 [Oryzias latipes]
MAAAQQDLFHRLDGTGFCGTPLRRSLTRASKRASAGLPACSFHDVLCPTHSPRHVSQPPHLFQTTGGAHADWTLQIVRRGAPQTARGGRLFLLRSEGPHCQHLPAPFKHPSPSLEDRPRGVTNIYLAGNDFLFIPVKLSLDLHVQELRALVDSGAEQSLIDQQLVINLSIPTEPLETPIEASGLGGQPLSRITHRTKPVLLISSGNHRNPSHEWSPEPVALWNLLWSASPDLTTSLCRANTLKRRIHAADPGLCEDINQ